LVNYLSCWKLQIWGKLLTKLSRQRVKAHLTKTRQLQVIQFNVHHLLAGELIIFVSCNISDEARRLYFIVLCFIVCSKGGQSSSNSDRSARELEEIFRQRNEKASNFEHIRVRTLHYFSMFTIVSGKIYPWTFQTVVKSYPIATMRQNCTLSCKRLSSNLNWSRTLLMALFCSLENGCFLILIHYQFSPFLEVWMGDTILWSSTWFRFHFTGSLSRVTTYVVASCGAYDIVWAWITLDLPLRNCNELFFSKQKKSLHSFVYGWTDQQQHSLLCCYSGSLEGILNIEKLNIILKVRRR